MKSLQNEKMSSFIHLRKDTRQQLYTQRKRKGTRIQVYGRVFFM